jgi:hypothetical protein
VQGNHADHQPGLAVAARLLQPGVDADEDGWLIEAGNEVIGGGGVGHAVVDYACPA